MARRSTSTRSTRARRRGNPRNKAPGTRNISTRQYGLATTRGWKNAAYAYPRGVGNRKGKAAAYPINTLARARNALARAAQPQTSGNVAHIKMVLRKKGGAYRQLADRSTVGQRPPPSGDRGSRRRR